MLKEMPTSRLCGKTRRHQRQGKILKVTWVGKTHHLKRNNEMDRSYQQP